MSAPMGSQAEQAVVRELILSIGAEGGGLRLTGERTQSGWRFFFEASDWSAERLTEDHSGPVARVEKTADSWDGALELISRYPWHRLYPEFVHPEFCERVWIVARARLEEMPDSQADRSISLWRDLCFHQAG